MTGFNSTSHPNIDQEPLALRRIVSYEPWDGTFMWLERPKEWFSNGTRDGQWGAAQRWNGRFAGKPAFITPDKFGYLYAGIFGKSYFAHRVAWAIHYGAWPEGDIDHIDGVTFNNIINNLRDVTNIENMQNMHFSRANTSGGLGVVRSPTAKESWRARGRLNGKTHHIGTYGTFEEAVEASKLFRANYHPNHGKPRT